MPLLWRHAQNIAPAVGQHLQDVKLKVSARPGLASRSGCLKRADLFDIILILVLPAIVVTFMGLAKARESCLWLS